MTEATHEILGYEFTLEELVLLVYEGMTGLDMKKKRLKELQYTSVNVARFDKHTDEIEDYLEGWHEENLNSPEGKDETYLAWICETSRVTTVDDLKMQLVWEYIQLKAQEYLKSIDYPFGSR